MFFQFFYELNLPAVYFSVFYAIYVVYMIVSRNFSDLPAVVALGVVAIGYLFGYRPYKYPIATTPNTIIAGKSLKLPETIIYTT